MLVGGSLLPGEHDGVRVSGCRRHAAAAAGSGEAARVGRGREMYVPVDQPGRVEEIDASQLLPQDAGGMVAVHPAYERPVDLDAVRKQRDPGKVAFEGQRTCADGRRIRQRS